MDAELAERLDRLERILTDIRSGVSPGWTLLIVRSAILGAGYVVGTIIGLALLGWILSALGIIPGVSDLSNQLHGLVRP